MHGKRSFTLVCFYLGIVLLFVQILVVIIILHILDDPQVLSRLGVSSNINKFCLNLDYLSKDITRLIHSTSEIGLSLILLDKQLLVLRKSQNRNLTSVGLNCIGFKNAVLAIDYSTVAEKKNQLLESLIDDAFAPVTFYNLQPQQMITELNRVETALFLQRRAVLHIVFLHPREDSSWWFGDIRSDPAYKVKLASLNLTLQQIQLMKSEGAIERFETMQSTNVEEPNYLVPKDVNKYLSDISSSKFIECNVSRATIFRSKFHVDKSLEALRFRHKVWKMLSRVKIVLESLEIVFWLSSGTLLGYFRECDIIAHSKDVDIGVWATSYSEKLISEMQAHGFHLKISMGLPNDSMELSFIDKSGVKLDIFFFYQEANSYWNGGTQVKSGKKFKYIFPKFSLCWTFFKDLRVRIPCETEAYIRANYGPNWFTPVKVWDWKTSPYNVKTNGVWSSEQLRNAVKMYV